jgi:predicted nucleic acid-binding protein
MGIPAYHEKFVIDTSIIAQWFVRPKEGELNKAISLRDLHLKGQCQLVIPEFALLEILSAIRSNNRATEEDGDNAVKHLKGLNLEIISLTTVLLRKTNAISWAKEYKVNIFDAANVAVAEELGYPLLTTDEIFLKKMKGHSIVLDLDELDFPQENKVG